MADLEPTTPPLDAVDAVPTSQDPASDSRGEHEASDVVDQDPNAQVDSDIAQDDAQVEPPLDEMAKDTDGDLHEPTQEEDVFTEPAPASITEVSKKADGASSKRATPASRTAPVKSVPGKAISSTSANKKALHSATLSTGHAKAASPSKPATAPSSPLSKTTTSSTAKKPATTTSANPTKTTTMSTARGSGPPPPSRRSSMLPPRAPSATGVHPAPKSRTSTLLASLASATISKPPPEANTRPSVVSPAGSVASLKTNTTGSAVVPPTVAPPARPRAAVSEAVKRTPSSSRPSLPPTAVQPPPSRPQMRPMGSISSIREVRDDGKALEGLQQRLREATESLAAKSDVMTTLEAKILRLEVSLDESLVDARTKTSFIEQLQISKQSLDGEISNLKVRLQQVQADHARDRAALNSASNELTNANKSMAGQAKSIKHLEAQIETLHTDLTAAHDNFESLRSSSDQSSAEAAAAAQMEREAFLRAKADVETISAELNGLRAAHNSALQEAAAKSIESQQRAAEVITLTTQIGELKADREESAAKISELEVEVLELKESQESAEDEHKRTLDYAQKLEAKLTEAVAATQQAISDAEARDAGSTQKAANVALLHANELQLINSDLTKAVSEVEGLKAELAAVHATHNATKAAAQASTEAHEQEMEEAEQLYLSKHIELSEEIKRLTAELEGMDAKYDAKVNAVKAEHDQLLQEAFERAKNEAGEIHGEDLQALRTESQATIEQLRTAHESTVNDLRLEHEAVLESQVGALEKKLSSLSLELRATQDDLSKAKAAVDASRVEGEGLRAQLEDARASSVSASPNADQAADIERLTKEIANLRDENVMLNDVLAVTKESLSEMSANHSKELEEATRIRVEEVMKLRSTHEGELSTLAAQKSELALSLSDLEGEISTLKARLAAVEPAVVPRSNGAVHASTTMVTREELQKAHEAHNLKMHDLQAQHDRAIRVSEMEVVTLQARLDEVQQDVARKSMEIQYLEQEQEENQDSITRLKADLEALKPSAP